MKKFPNRENKMLCPICGTQMKPLLTGVYCPNDGKHDHLSCQYLEYITLSDSIYVLGHYDGKITNLVYDDGQVFNEIPVADLDQEQKSSYDFLSESGNDPVMCFVAERHEHVVFFIRKDTFGRCIDEGFVKPTRLMVKT